MTFVVVIISLESRYPHLNAYGRFAKKRRERLTNPLQIKDDVGDTLLGLAPHGESLRGLGPSVGGIRQDNPLPAVFSFNSTIGTGDGRSDQAVISLNISKTPALAEPREFL